MKELIEKAFEVHDALKNCALGTHCDRCGYINNGCFDCLMLDTVNVIERMIEEIDNGQFLSGVQK